MAESVRTSPQLQSTRPAEHPINVGDLERWLSLLGGGVLALYTVRRSLGNLLLLAGAGALLSRGLTGYCQLYNTMGVSTVSQDSGSPHTLSATSPEEKPLIAIARS
jgi:uncharacterized membrane protein